MEADEIEQRIRATHRIAEAAAESEEELRPLVETLHSIVEFMTREELINTLLRVGSAYDRMKLETKNRQELSAQVEENLRREIALRDSAIEEKDLKIAEQGSKLEEKDSKIAEQGSKIADQDAEIKRLKAQLADIQHSEATLKQEKFAGKSKRGIDKKTTTAKGRDDDKDDFDGTPGSVSDHDSSEPATEAAKAKPMSLSQLKEMKARRPSSYKLADAAVKVVHECDLSRLPEGAVLIPGGETTETIFHEEKIIRADVYKFVRYRMLEDGVDEDGNPVKVWREHTMHFPKSEWMPDGQTPAAPMKRGNLPDQVPGTHETPSMLANLIFEHYYCNVPMNRLSHAFAEFGFSVGRSTLEHLDTTVASMLKPVHKALLDDILSDDAVIFCDETWQRLHLKDSTVKVYDWIIGNKKKKAVAYAYDEGGRGRKVIAGLLKGRKIKAVHTDGYNAYFFLQDVGITHICCGAHVWRKIKEWYERTSDPEAKALLLDLGELFMMDARLRETNAPPEEVLRKRNSPETIDIISRFCARIDVSLEKCDGIPKIGFRALNYAKETASRMFRWREDADYELDNNFAEQSARPIATSRKTSLFHCSHTGAENDCIIRSFIETCRLRGISIVAWFKSFFKAVINGRSDYAGMLPGILSID